mmetsp:Transcript_5448/g.22051  ORF Transcript_5448/g.22051 Transcript_5448/m.22051 type:complete len:340 (-) Transcript_5448:35-1054(-)
MHTQRKSRSRRGGYRASRTFLSQLSLGGFPGDENPPGEDSLFLLDIRALGERADPVVQVLVGDALGVHLRAVLGDLREHVPEVPLEVVRAVPPGDVLEPALLDEVDVHRGAAHERRRVAVGEALQRLLVRAVSAHDVGEHEHAARLQAAHQLLEQRHLVAGVAQHLARPHRVELARPLLGEGVVDVPHLRVHQMVDAELLAPLHVQRVLAGTEVVSGDLAPEALRHGVRAAAVTRAEIKHVHVGGDGLRPVHLGHHPLGGVRGGLLDAVFGVLVDAEVDVVAAAAHHALVKHPRDLLIVLLEDFVRHFLLAELLVHEVRHGYGSVASVIRWIEGWKPGA